MPSFRLRHLGLAFSLQLSAFSLSVSATETTDLGQNLSYLRVEELADAGESLASVIPENRPLVLDLRYATATGESAAGLAAALGRRRGPAPLFILVAPGTPPALAAALEKLPPGAITIGVKEAIPAPRVVVAQPAGVDRRARAALAAGVPPAALINGKVEKDRHDEASIVRDFASGHRDPGPAAGPPPAGEPGADDTLDSAGQAPVPTDRVLQRAVHLQRALFAIRAR